MEEHFTKLFKDFVDQQSRDFHELVTTKAIESVNEKVMTMVGKDLYNYDDFETIDIDYSYSVSSGHYNSDKYKKIKNTKFIIGERVVVKLMNKDNLQQNPTDFIYLTNYGTIIVLKTCGGDLTDCSIDTYRCNFWIPTDYLYIIKNLIPLAKCHTFDINQFKSLIEHLRDNLANGHYVKNNVDIHYMDVYKEKKKLEEEREVFEIYRESEQKRLEKERRILDTKLEKDRAEIAKTMEELKQKQQKYTLIAKKIEMEKEKLRQERELLCSVKLSSISLDSMLEDVEIH
jgi:hypothetical protein